MPQARPTSDRRVADLVAAGQVRFAVFPPQYRRDAGGVLTGPWVEVMRALAAHIGVPATIAELANPDQLVESLAAGSCDIGSLGFDPARAAAVGGFSPPFMQVDYSYLVPAGSAIRSVADADRPAIRIAAVRQTPRRSRCCASSNMPRRSAPTARTRPSNCCAPDASMPGPRSGRRWPTLAAGCPAHLFWWKATAPIARRWWCRGRRRAALLHQRIRGRPKPPACRAE